jgi:phosphohistidine phosphatase
VQTLYLLRHAKSSWADPTLPDRERPLAPRGRRDAKRIANHLRGLDVRPELVLGQVEMVSTSSSIRGTSIPSPQTRKVERSRVKVNKCLANRC